MPRKTTRTACKVCGSANSNSIPTCVYCGAALDHSLGMKAKRRVRYGGVSKFDWDEQKKFDPSPGGEDATRAMEDG